MVDHYDLPKPLAERETAVISPIVRHEEALSVAKERAETGRVRVRKWVETESVTVEVALERETVRVEREPIGRPAAEGVELGEDEISVSVYAERPVVDKRVVAVERVRLEKGVELDDVTIEDELRVERVAVEEGDE